jgi:hypothetical protein
VRGSGDKAGHGVRADHDGSRDPVATVVGTVADVMTVDAIEALFAAEGLKR